MNCIIHLNLNVFYALSEFLLTTRARRGVTVPSSAPSENKAGSHVREDRGKCQVAYKLVIAPRVSGAPALNGVTRTADANYWLTLGHQLVRPLYPRARLAHLPLVVNRGCGRRRELPVPASVKLLLSPSWGRDGPRRLARSRATHMSRSDVENDERDATLRLNSLGSTLIFLQLKQRRPRFAT